MSVTIASLAEKVVVTLMAKPISDGVVNFIKKSPEDKVAKALERALEKVSPDNEFWKNDVKRQIGNVIEILIHTLDDPRYFNNNPLPNYLDKKTIESFKDCLKEEPEAWDYIQKVHYEEILLDIRTDVREIKDDVKESKVIEQDTNIVSYDTNERVRRIEEKLSGVNIISPVQQVKCLKIFLASSINELQDERLKLADYINDVVAPILYNAGFYVRLYKCEDNPSANFGGSSQNEIDKELEESDISVFLFKKKAGRKTIHEFDLARELQSQVGRKHGIFVYCYDVSENEKREELINFQKRLEAEEFYWNPCKDTNALTSHFLPGLLKQLFGENAVSNANRNNNIETVGDARFKEYEDTKERESLLRENIHQDIECLLEQIKDIIKDESINIAVRIAKVLELYQKADLWASKTDYDEEKYSDLLFDYASFLDDYGLYRDAESIYLRLIKLIKEVYGEKSERASISYNNIGGVYWKLGDYDTTLEYLHKVLTIRGEAYGAKHPNTASVYNNIGLVWKDKGNYEKSLEYHFKALKIREEKLDTNNPAIAQSLMNIASVYYDQGYYNEALEHLQKALVIVREASETDKASIATLYNTIGLVYLTQDNYQEAHKFLNLSLTIREKEFGTDYPETAISYNSLGMLFNKKGNYDEAMKYLSRALAIRKKYLPSDHPSTATSCHEIGIAYQNIGDFKTALDYYTKAYQIRKNKLGKEHPYTKSVIESINIVKQALQQSPPSTPTAVQ